MAKDLYAQEGCSPYRLAVLPWVQLPLWITLSFALRNMAGVFPGSSGVVNATLSTEGCLWFQDLAIPDSYYILPVVLVATNLCNIEVCTNKKTIELSHLLFVTAACPQETGAKPIATDFHQFPASFISSNALCCHTDACSKSL